MIYDADKGQQGRFGLTEAQYETMTATFEHGYYEISRDLDTEELATEFAISHQALSERLCHGHKALVKNTPMIGPRVPDDSWGARVQNQQPD